MEINLLEGFSRMQCGECGIVFFVPTSFYDDRLNNGGGWHCPNGHDRAFTEPRVVKLEKILATKEKELVNLRSSNLELKVGFDNRERDLARLRKKLKVVKK